MADNEGNKLWIVTDVELAREPERRERGLRDFLGGGKTAEVDTSVLKTNMKSFLDQLRDILAVGRDKIGEFQIDQVDISAQVTGSGKICLLGSGVQMGVTGGIRFVLKRAP